MYTNVGHAGAAGLNRPAARTDSDGSFLLEWQRNTGTFTPTWMRSLIYIYIYIISYHLDGIRFIPIPMINYKIIYIYIMSPFQQEREKRPEWET